MAGLRVSKIVVLFTLCLTASISLPAIGVHRSQTTPRQSTPTIASSSSSTLILNTTGASLTSGIVDSAAGYAYFGTAGRPATIFKIRLSDFTNVANLTLSTGNAALAAVLDSSREIAYFGMDTGQIVEVNLTSFTNTTSVTPGLGGITAGAIDPGNGFAYFGTMTGNILRVRLSDLTVNKTLTLNPQNSIASAVIDTANGYAYFGASGCGPNIYYTPPNVVVKVRLSDFSIVAQLDPGVDCLTSAGIDPSGGFVYFGSSSVGGSRIIRISLADFSIKDVLTPASGGFVSSFVLDPTRGLGYTFGGLFVTTFRLSDFSQIGSEVHSFFLSRSVGVLDPATGYAYFTLSVYQASSGTTGAVLRISPGSLPSSDFSLAPSPARISFQDGGVGAAYINVDSNNYTGTINLSASVFSNYALQPSVDVLQPTLTLISNGENSSILTVSAPIQDDIPAATFVITVTGTSGLVSRSVSFEVTITPGASHFVPIINSPSLAMNPYANDSSIALVTHTGFSGTVNFTATITPNGPNAPTVNVNPSSATVNLPTETYTGVSSLYVTANSNTATGQYEVDVTATSLNETHTAQLCVLVIPHGSIQFCLLSNPNRLVLGAGQTRLTLITQYMPHPPFNASMYLGTINLAANVVSGPSNTGLTATLNPATFPLPHVIPGPQQLETTLTVTASPTAPPGDYVLRISSTNGTITGTLDITVTITASPVEGIPSVFPGDWAGYQVSSTWSSTPTSLPVIPQIAQYLGSYAAVFRVGATVGNETAGLLSTAYLNGTVNVQEISGNTFTGSPALFPWVVGSSLTFNTTAYRVFGGASRLATILNVTASSTGVTVTGSWTWDYQTGILLDYQLTVQGTGNLGTINGQVHVRMVDTNLWAPTAPYFAVRPTQPFLTVEQYTTTNTRISIASTNSFNGRVTLTIQSLPSNPSVSLSINNTLSIQPGQTSNATLTVYSSIPGQFIVLVNATSGSQFHLALLGMTVVRLLPPTLTISVGPNPANTGESVTLNFTIHSDVTVSHVTINWGDGTTSSPSPAPTNVSEECLIPEREFCPSWGSHIYTTTGSSTSHTYVINMTATNNAGEGFATVTEIVNDRAPIVTITAISPLQAFLGEQVRLNFTAIDLDGTVSSVSINWGDGSNSYIVISSATPLVYSYTKTGTFTITITATDNSGSTSQASTSILIVNAPPAQAAAILGLAPLAFYSLIGIGVAVVVAGTLLTLRRMRKHTTRLGPSMASRSTGLDALF
jgi:PKD domain-containing protein